LSFYFGKKRPKKVLAMNGVLYYVIFQCNTKYWESSMTDKNSPAWATSPDAAPQEAVTTGAEANSAADAEKKAQKAATKAAKDAENAEKKAQREAAKAQRNATKEAAKAEKEAAKAAKIQAKEDKKKAREAAILARNEAKAKKVADREKSKQPEQNGIRRPKPEGLCGKAWALFDRLSQEKGAPVAAAEIRVEMAKGSDLNEGNVKAEYPRWKKFHGLSGMIHPAGSSAPQAPQAPAE
jgi:membrane protein involved in colicin uptake